jgi:hypothetical protein
MPKLGPELFELLNARQLTGNQAPVIYGAGGLSDSEIATIESLIGFQLPDDFALLLANMRDPGGIMFPWSNFRRQDYDSSIALVLEGIEFDIENGFWMDRWGERPAGLPAAIDIARNDFATWPKLLPISGHRFLAAEPCRVGNPVFSIVQTDIIYYGADLAHYLVNEFVDHDWKFHAHDQPIQRIDIWSDFAEGVFEWQMIAPR